jgi:fatty acyl-CoA reductase
MLEIGIHGICFEIPAVHTIWKADGGVTLSKTWNFIRLIQSQVIPAIILDSMLKLKGKRPRLLKIQRKMYEANKALSYFVTHNWDFKNKNFFKLCTYLRNEDSKSFDYRFIRKYDVILFARQTVMGFRRYLLKEKDDTLPRARKMYRRLKLADDMLTIIPYIVTFYIIFIKYDFLQVAISHFGFSN